MVLKLLQTSSTTAPDYKDVISASPLRFQKPKVRYNLYEYKVVPVRQVSFYCTQ